jgi:phage tail sheath gpL-like
MNVSMVTNGNTLGITYAIASVTSGSGTPSVAAQLSNIGAAWRTLAINSYGTESTTLSLFEAFNGIPDATTPTGRFVGNVMKPLVALTGSIADNDATLTDSRLNDVTIAICPAPLSTGFQFEAAANVAVLQGNNASNTPHLDIEGQSYPDMPTPATIGTMAVYANRDVYVKKGCSTVDLVGGKYVIQDLVTTYHKLGETPPQFRYVRNLTVDYNIRYAYYLLEQINVVDHVIAIDTEIVTVAKVIKPKQWKGILATTLFPDLAKRALITNVDFSVNNLNVGISSTNPDRFETAFSYKRTGTARVIATTATAGFNFGN